MRRMSCRSRACCRPGRSRWWRLPSSRTSARSGSTTAAPGSRSRGVRRCRCKQHETLENQLSFAIKTAAQADHSGRHHRSAARHHRAWARAALTRIQSRTIHDQVYRYRRREARPRRPHRNPAATRLNFFDVSLINQIADALEESIAISKSAHRFWRRKAKAFLRRRNFRRPGAAGGRGARQDRSGFGTFRSTISMSRRCASSATRSRSSRRSRCSGDRRRLGLAVAADFRVTCPEARFAANLQNSFPSRASG